MDSDDQKDIIKKVKQAGKKDGSESSNMDGENNSTDITNDGDNGGADNDGINLDNVNEIPEKDLEEAEVYENLFLENPPKNNMFQPGSNDKLNEASLPEEERILDLIEKLKELGSDINSENVMMLSLFTDGGTVTDEEKINNIINSVTDNELSEESKGLWYNIHAKRERGEKPAKPGDKNYPNKKQWDKLTKENIGDSNNYMFWQNLKNIHNNTEELLNMNQQEVDELLENGHAWAVDHISTSKDDIEEVYHFLEANIDDYNVSDSDKMMSEHESNNYMYWSNLKTIHHASGELLNMDCDKVDTILSDGHGWALDHIATSANDMEAVYHFLANTLNAYDGDTEGGYEDEYGSVEYINLNEAEYKGREVKLGKPTKGDVKKFKVYVKNEKGNVIKVNFGDPNMEIKRDNPERRKSFRARHKCSQAHDRTTPKYWSCKMWSTKPVSDIVGENLVDSKNISKFVIKKKVQETFNQDSMNTEPMPIVKPAEPKIKPMEKPNRTNKPFTIKPNSVPSVDPKALNEGLNDYPIYHKTFSSAVQTAAEYAKSKGYTISDDEWFNSVATGPSKPSEGKTNRYTITLYKDGKEQKKSLHIQVYGMKNTYELNVYIA